MTSYVLALDQGTTSSRAIVFDRNGHVVSVAQQEFEQIFPAPGHVEHDPEAIWSSQIAVAQQSLRQAQLSASDVAAIGVTNQRETTLLWERETGRPVGNAIVWQSRVSADICERLKSDGCEAVVREKTGLVIDPYFSGTKIKYLLDTIEGLRERAKNGEVLFGTVDTFLLWRLTGGKCHVTDVSNASRTLLFNIHTLDWDDELLTLLDVPRAMLPEVRSSSEIYGATEPDLFGTPIPISGDAGDQQAAAFGQACFEPGSAKNTYGTGCFLLLNTGETPVVSRNGLITTIGWKLGDSVTYCLEGSIFIAGAVVQWLRDGLGLIENAAEIESVASTVSDSGGVYLVPAFVGLGAPYWDQDARGIIVGVTRGTTRAHLARAGLDSIAFQTCDVLAAMQQDANLRLQSLKVDGGACSNDLLMQFQADLLDVCVQRPAVQETTALGAAYLAGLAVGFWPDLDTLKSHWSLEREFLPTMDSQIRNRRLERWKEAVRRCRNWETRTEN